MWSLMLALETSKPGPRAAKDGTTDMGEHVSMHSEASTSCWCSDFCGALISVIFLAAEIDG